MGGRSQSQQNKPSARPHPLEELRPVDPSVNKAPGRDWNQNVLYYSNTPKEKSGLFFSKSFGLIELGMEHNTQLSHAIVREKNYWKALSYMQAEGYQNGHVRIGSSFLASPAALSVLSGAASKLVGGSEKVYPMGPPSLSAKHKDFQKTVALFDKIALKKKGAKVLQVNLITGYEDKNQLAAFSNDAKQLAQAVRKTYGSEMFSSDTYDPAKQVDSSFGAFAKYLYRQTDSLPPGSVVILEVFTHGDKSPFIHRESLDAKMQVATVGVLSWANPAQEVNEWEFKQLVNSLAPHLTVAVRGNQCLGGQFCDGELTFPKYVAPSNSKINPEQK